MMMMMMICGSFSLPPLARVCPSNRGIFKRNLTQQKESWRRRSLFFFEQQQLTSHPTSLVVVVVEDASMGCIMEEEAFINYIYKCALNSPSGSWNRCVETNKKLFN
eukprot:GDKJ01038496.1.p4 GENE.GDKJ01038496.1~~GDKJ01038496.1.p4  ORF type:complete len:106 (+),score=23.77 GDKJ01038496.1:1654-1971(+)